ncbi:hypothetical protein ES705_44232 [subsurface metagenome]
MEPLQKMGYTTIDKLKEIEKPGKLYQEMMGYRKKNKLVFNNIRILHPASANEDGSYTYIFIADPIIPGVNYNIMHYLVQVYDEEEAREKMKMFSESLVEPRTLIELTQSKH